jgi:ATP-binding cassette subfamily B (MDR/TAP) protein 1
MSRKATTSLSQNTWHPIHGSENVFKTQFENASNFALATGICGAFFEGCVASSLICLAEALLFARESSNGRSPQLGRIHGLVGSSCLSVSALVVLFFCEARDVTIIFPAAEKIAKSTQATRDFNHLLQFGTDTDESRGNQRPSIVDHVSFRYPEPPDLEVLKVISLDITSGECVAVVGTSSSGKSTVAAFLQWLYEPASGSISIGHSELKLTNVRHLRERVAVVSQNPNLFDITISKNISHGDKSLTDADGLTDADVCKAAKTANVHDFIMSLPHGYETMVGENASLISGGQAQRLQIAWPSTILILDEYTSDLDPNQAAVMETIRHAKVGRTTIINWR